jgi:hypothetical protein
MNANGKTADEHPTTQYTKELVKIITSEASTEIQESSHCH